MATSRKRNGGGSKWMSCPDADLTIKGTPPPQARAWTPPDVYLYQALDGNGGRPLPLCLSHAVARRRVGAAVELLSERPNARARCADCDGHP